MSADNIGRAIAASAKKKVESIIASGGTVTLSFLPPLTLPANENVKMTNIGDNINAQIQLEIPRGTNGKSAYELAVIDGFVGSVQDWLLSLIGNGVPLGGQPNQVLAKIDGIDYNTKWIDLEGTANITTEDTDSISLDIHNNKIKSNVNISMENGNALEIKNDGLYVQTSTTAQLLFFNHKEGSSVVEMKTPESNVIVMPITWFGANPGTWQEIAKIKPSDETKNIIIEFIQGNRFSVKFWLLSEMAQNNAQIRIQAIDKNDGTILASATKTLNLLSDGITPIPVLLENIYQISRNRKLEEIDIIISIMPTTFGIQVGIVSNPPNETSYINIMSTGGVSGSMPDSLYGLVLTQNEYDAMTDPNPNYLYFILSE